jgi:SSS family solute:Na+ symporter
MQLRLIDYLIIAIYFAFVLGIGFLLKRKMKTSADFFLSGRSIPAWITGLAFISANLGAQEVIGMGASGAKYGLMTAHFYWLGAIPAMIFVGLFMMPFYYGSRARSVPEYLKLRFDEKTRALNATSFAIMTVFSSGVSMYAMGKLLQLLLGWDFSASIGVAAAVVLAYTFLGGLTSAIYNEVLQFFLIVLGFLPLALLGLRDVGGFGGLRARLATEALARGHASDALTSTWRGVWSGQNPMGVEALGLVLGLGFVLSFGYWCTDFLVVQRAMAAESMTAARRTPLIAAVPKMLFPFLVILPGMLALTVTPPSLPSGSGAPIAVLHVGAALRQTTSAPAVGIIPPKLDDKTHAPLRDQHDRLVPDYDLATPLLLARYFPSGLLGLGLCALIASFMSGMAGNTTAFNTVFTYDLYQTYLHPKATDAHLLWMGRMSTVLGIGISIGAAYVARQFNNIMDLLQLVFAFINAPLFATFMLGMFWRRATGHGAFFGLLAGTGAAALHHGLSLPSGEAPGLKGGFLGVLVVHRSEMAQNFWTALCAWVACFVVTVLVSLVTRPRPDAELRGLVYSLTPRPTDEALPFHRHPGWLAAGVIGLTLILNLVFR